LWWDETYGPGPFEVVGVVDHTPDDIPQGLLLKTRLGEREVNSVWLAPEGEPDWQGYDLETLTALLDG
jgi:hypothetical protein